MSSNCWIWLLCDCADADWRPHTSGMMMRQLRISAVDALTGVPWIQQDTTISGSLSGVFFRDAAFKKEYGTGRNVLAVDDGGRGPGGQRDKSLKVTPLLRLVRWSLSIQQKKPWSDTGPFLLPISGSGYFNRMSLRVLTKSPAWSL